MYYKQATMGDLHNDDFCFVNTLAKGAWVNELTNGTFLKDYPPNPFKIKLHLARKWLGLQCPDFLGNTKFYLIVKKEISDIILQYNVGEIQVFPFTLINHKGRIHSRDYVFLNPLGACDCLHQTLSEIDRDDDGEVDFVDKFVLDKEKIHNLPDLFRVKEDDSEYIYSKTLVDRLRKENVTNFIVEELEIG